MQFCFLCDEHITPANNSDEHIFPNAIGGKRVVTDFLCVKCNNSTGHRWDAELVRQLNQWTIFFDVVGRRKGPPPALRIETSAGEKLLPRMIKLSSYFGGELSGRSVVKTAVAFAKYLAVDISKFHPAREYLRNADGFPCFGYYYDEGLLQNRPSGLPLHCVGIDGDPNTGLVLAYVEYFGIYRIVACLSETYLGAAFRDAYAIDPTTGDESRPTVVLPFGRNDLKAIYAYKRIRRDVQESVFHNVIPPALKRDRARAIQTAVEDALAHAWANCGAQPGERATEVSAKEINRLCQAGSSERTSATCAAPLGTPRKLRRNFRRSEPSRPDAAPPSSLVHHRPSERRSLCMPHCSQMPPAGRVHHSFKHYPVSRWIWSMSCSSIRMRGPRRKLYHPFINASL